MLIYRVVLDNQKCILGYTDDIKYYEKDGQLYGNFSKIENIAGDKYWSILESHISKQEMKNQLKHWFWLLQGVEAWNVKIIGENDEYNKVQLRCS